MLIEELPWARRGSARYTEWFVGSAHYWAWDNLTGTYDFRGPDIWVDEIGPLEMQALLFEHSPE